MLYILNLQQNRIFVYSNSSVTVDSITDIKRECEYLYDFPKKYTIETIVDYKPNTTYDQVNTVVKQYMMLHGIDFVRGGSYADPVLSKEHMELLTTEMSYNTHINKCVIILELYNEFTDAPYEKQDEIEESWSKYAALKEQYRSITNPYDLKCDWLNGELEWMKTQLTNRIIYKTASSTNILEFQRYMTIIPYIKRIPLIANSIRCNMNQPAFDLRKIFQPTRVSNVKWYAEDTSFNEQTNAERIFFEYDYSSDDPDSPDFNIFVDNPQFIFDPYFVVHHHWTTNAINTSNPKYIIHVFSIILYYFNYIRNHLIDLEYSIEHFPFMTAMKYEQIPPPLWGEMYSDFIDKYWNMMNYHISTNPNAGGTANFTNDDAT